MYDKRAVELTLGFPKNDREILEELLADLSMIGNSNDNGADYMSCPCCGQTTDVKGNHWGADTDPLEYEHHEGCSLIAAIAHIYPKNSG